MDKVPVGVLGATGLVGQRLVSMLAGHPWFELVAVAASDQSVGKKYGEAVRWQLTNEIPRQVQEVRVQPCEPAYVPAQIVFSALPGEVAAQVELTFAQAGAIVSSNASPHRMDEDVPLVIPEVNPEHLQLLDWQRENRKWDGALICNANCSTIHLTLALKPLADRFGLKQVIVTTMQALSGAGYPGVPSLDVLDNVIPYIGGEEDKVEQEPLKILGKVNGNGITQASIAISAHCNRVATREGHMETVSVQLEQKTSVEEIITAFEEYCGLPQSLNLPTAPKQPLIVRREQDRPQVRRDRNVEGGMATVIGRIRKCNVLDYKFVLLGHNTVRGAAGGTILNAELVHANIHSMVESLHPNG